MAKSKGKEVLNSLLIDIFCFHINPFTCGIQANLSPTAIGLIDL
jgi:hypothetical protein